MPDIAAGRVPAATMAKLLDVSERRLQQLRKEGVIPGAGRGQYELVGTVQGYVRFLRDSAQRDSKELETAKLRKTNAEAELKENEVRQQRGELIEIGPVVDAWSKIVTEIRTNILAVATKVAPKLTDALSTAQKADLISGEIDKALEGLSRAEVIPEPPKKTG